MQGSLFFPGGLAWTSIINLKLLAVSKLFDVFIFYWLWAIPNPARTSNVINTLQNLFFIFIDDQNGWRNG